MATIFISYRRADSASETGRLYDRLVERYGRAQVFKDVDSIPAGVDFSDYIAESIQASDVALVVIGPRWLSASSGFAQRRLDDAADFVRVEIETALRLGVPVIPVLVGGASLPSARRLPENLRPLLRQNGLQLRQDPDFSHDAERIFAAIDYWQAQPRQPITPPAPEPAPVLELPITSPAPERAAQPAPQPKVSPVATAVADRSAVAARGGRPALRRAPLLAVGSALLLIAVVAAFILSQSSGETSLSTTDRQGTQIAGAQATHAVATTTADARRGLQPWRPLGGGPGPCDPTEQSGIHGSFYWQIDQPTYVTCEPDGKTARLAAGKANQQLPAIWFWGLPWYYPQYNSAFPNNFTVDMDVTFTTSDTHGFNNEYCLGTMVELQVPNVPPSPWLTFCRDGSYAPIYANAGAKYTYTVKPTNHLQITVKGSELGMALNGKTVLTMTPYEPPISAVYLYLTWDSEASDQAITISNFVFTPTAQ